MEKIILENLIKEKEQKNEISDFLINESLYFDLKKYLLNNKTQLKPYENYVKKVETELKKLLEEKQISEKEQYAIEKDGYKFAISVKTSFDLNDFLIKNLDETVDADRFMYIVKKLLPFIKFQQKGTFKAFDENGEFTQVKSGTLMDELIAMGILSKDLKEIRKKGYNKVTFTTVFKPTSKEVKKELKQIETKSTNELDSSINLS